ncbi:hypothetical protein [Kitasatospora sp. GP82]|uniref:hypothetical protein n=1 Tax=Kitasatospora sp. GP82 TaxID=3035089 RepID=UPI002475E891|nr:hypothetical protein [Kitasatospora sp. GP82]
MESLTEHRDVPGPLVYGYLRLIGTGHERLSALQAALLEYCRQHELHLSGVFTERENLGSRQSAAFTGLLDALALPDTYGAVVPAAAHLGPRPVAAERHRQIAALGRRLLVIRPEAGHRRTRPFIPTDHREFIAMADRAPSRPPTAKTRQAIVDAPSAHARMVLDQHRAENGQCVRGCGPWPCEQATDAALGAI